MKNKALKIWGGWNANFNLILGLVLLFWGVYMESILWSLLKGYQPSSEFDTLLPELLAPISNIGLGLLCLVVAVLCFFGRAAKADDGSARAMSVIWQVLASLLPLGVAAVTVISARG